MIVGSTDKQPLLEIPGEVSREQCLSIIYSQPFIFSQNSLELMFLTNFWLSDASNFLYNLLVILVVDIIVFNNAVSLHFLWCHQVFELRKLLPTSVAYDFNIHVSYDSLPKLFCWHCSSIILSVLNCASNSHQENWYLTRQFPSGEDAFLLNIVSKYRA